MGKCTVDLITGFLASGKTSIIKSILTKATQRDEIVVIQCEKGTEQLTGNFLNKKGITLKDFASNDEITEERMARLLKFYTPTRLIIECNGIGDIKRIIEIFNSKLLKQYVKMGVVANLVDSTTLNMFLKNIPSLVMPNLQLSNLIILNKSNNISDETTKEYLTMIETLNLHAHIVTCGSKEELESILNKSNIVNKLLG